MQFTAPYSQTLPSVLVLQESEVMPPSGTVGPVQIPLPPQTTSVQLLAAQTAGPSEILRVSVVGVNSGLTYLSNADLPVDSSTGLTFSVSGVVDSAIDVTWSNPSIATVTYTLSVVANLGSESNNVMCTCTCTGGGGGAMIAFGIYTALSITGGTWTKVAEVGAVILQADNATFDIPSGGVAQVQAGASVISADGVNPVQYGLATPNAAFEVHTAVTTEILSGSLSDLIDFDTQTSFQIAVVAGTTNVDAVSGPYAMVSIFTRP